MPKNKKNIFDGSLYKCVRGPTFISRVNIYIYEKLNFQPEKYDSKIIYKYKYTTVVKGMGWRLKKIIN